MSIKWKHDVFILSVPLLRLFCNECLFVVLNFKPKFLLTRLDPQLRRHKLGVTPLITRFFPKVARSAGHCLLTFDPHPLSFWKGTSRHIILGIELTTILPPFQSVFKSNNPCRISLLGWSSGQVSWWLWFYYIILIKNYKTKMCFNNVNLL